MKRVIIIGATSGMGKEMAALYAEKGYLVGITGRRQHLLRQMEDRYPEMKIAPFDVTGSDNQKHLQALIAALGGLDLFIYNAGFGSPSANLNVEMELSITRTNVLGCVELTAYAFNYFAEQGYGQIAITSSVAALRGNSFAPAYSASKAFVSKYAEGLNIKARKLKKDIVVTDLRPGFVDTKGAKGTDRFWVATPQKAAAQMVVAIAQKKRVAYVTRRWWLVGQVMKIIPFRLYRRWA